jgi:exopolysaccharide biosynthesis WecB/TagA/CpsF family protein
MIDLGKRNLLGVRVDAIDYEAAVERIIAAAKARRHLSMSALAVHGLMTGVLDRTHRHRLNAFELLAPDGQPVRWALNGLFKTALADRVYGPNLMIDVCRRAAQEGMPIYLFGGDDRVLSDLRAGLRQRVRYLTVAGSRPSKFRPLTTDERTELLKEIRGSGARIVFVGLGCPRQEVFVYEMREALPMPMLAVGAAFRFHAGHIAQAPPALQRCGLEWAFRLATEPRRLWKRYLLLNPLYVSLLAFQALGLGGFDPENTEPPKQELRYG